MGPASDQTLDLIFKIKVCHYLYYQIYNFTENLSSLLVGFPLTTAPKTLNCSAFSGALSSLTHRGVSHFCELGIQVPVLLLTSCTLEKVTGLTVLRFFSSLT